MNEFCQRARAWIADNLPHDWRSASAETHGEQEFLAIRRQWSRMLYEAGWLGLSWPQQYGGQGLTLLEEAAFAEEFAAARAPDFINRNAVGYIGPTLIAHGSDAQKQHFLPRILAGDDLWCQGYSEPKAGSDLASLQTTASDCGDHWLVNGQKVWITLGSEANWCYLLARTSTDRPRHRGISAMVVDMNSPGIEAVPITTITGSHEFSELFFTDVKVPKDALLGELHGGWKVAMTTLGYERSINFFARTADFRHEVSEVAELARRTMRGDRPAIEDQDIAQRLARCSEEAEALRHTIARYLPIWAETRAPGAESSVIKVMWSEAHQRLMELALDILGPYQQQRTGDGAEGDGKWPLGYLFTRAETIYAGTSEVQRNVIAQRFLGLPREERPRD